MIGFVINHPKRDQPQFSNLVKYLSSKYKTKVVFIPLGQEHKIIRDFSDQLKIIVFNFIRKENLDVILLAKIRKIKIAVYEQEGAGGNDGLGCIKTIKDTLFYLPFIDHYFVWGEAQINYYNQTKIPFFHPKKISKVGCMRFDMIEKIKPQTFFNKRYICVNTNFTFVSPRFNTQKKEFDNRITNRNEAYNVVKKKFILEKERQLEFHRTIKQLVVEMDNCNFIIRPHPMENNRLWLKFNKFKNCQVVIDSNFVTWAKKSDLIIHINSSSSVEASFINIPSLTLKWLINDKTVPTFLPLLTSIKCENIDDLKDKIFKISKKKKLFRLSKKNQKIFKSFYGPKDYSAHIRLTKLLLDLYHDKNKFFFDNFVIIFFNFLRIKKKIKNVFKKIKIKKLKNKKNIDLYSIKESFSKTHKVKKYKNSVFIFPKN